MFTLRKCVQSLVNLEHKRNPVLTTAQRSVKRWVAPTLREMKRRRDKMPMQPLQHRSTFLEWNYQAELYAFGKRLNEEFRADVLQDALTHRSYINQEEERQRELGIDEPELSLRDNIKLAEEGQHIMSGYIKQYLRAALPLFPEEGICAVHDYLMTEEMLANISTHIGTKDLILCSDFPVTCPTLALTLKALVAALAASSGSERAERFIREIVLAQLAGVDVFEVWNVEEPMKILGEIMRRENRGEPEPRLVHEAGRNTILASYQVAIYVDKQFQGIGSGESVPTAIEMAASDVLRRLFHTAENMKPITFDKVTTSTTARNPTLQTWNSQNIVKYD